MSIQTDLTRLQSAKAAIKAAIEGKGVTVPDATLLDGMAPLIESIKAGGGIEGFQMASGNFTPSEDITGDYTIDSSLIPFETPTSRCYVFLLRSPSYINGVFGITGAMHIPAGNSVKKRSHCFVYINSSDLLSCAKSPQIAKNESNAVTFSFTSSYPALAGVKYYWLVIKE